MERNAKKIFWGVYFILAAVILIMYKLGTFGLNDILGVGIWGIVLTIFLLSFTIRGIMYRNVIEFVFSIAFILIIFDKPLGIEALSAWYILGAALLLSIGLSMLLKNKNRDWGWHPNHYDGRNYQSESTFQYSPNKDFPHCDQQNMSGDLTGEEVYYKTSFGSSIKYIKSDNFRKAVLKTDFGGMKVYFDNAIVQPGVTAEISVKTDFGSIHLYIPKTWTVYNNIKCDFGSVTESNTPSPTGETIVYLTGKTDFGNVEVTYI